MTDYEVIASGMDGAEIRLREDGTAAVYTEEEGAGEFATLSQDEIVAIDETLTAVEEEEEGQESPDLEEVTLGQHPLFGHLALWTERDDGTQVGAKFEFSDLIGMSDSL